MGQKKTRFVVRWLAVPLAILVGIGIVFFMAEVVFRMVGGSRPGVIAQQIPKTPGLTIFRPDPELGWAYVPNTAVRMQFGPPQWIEVYFDENGIRVPHSDFHLDPAKPTILFVGCSFTMGHALFYEETVAGRIASLPQFPLQAVNLGVQGYGTDQALLALKKFITRFNTRMVVYTFLDDHRGRNLNSSAKPFFKLKGDQLVFQDTLIAPKLQGSSRAIDAIRIFLDEKFGLFLRSRVLTQKLVLEMRKVCEAHGAKFVVIHWMWNDKDPSKDIFKGMGLDVINTLEGAPPGWAQMVNAYDNHPISNANIHVARLLLNYLLGNPSGNENPSSSAKNATSKP